MFRCLSDITGHVILPANKIYALPSETSLATMLTITYPGLILTCMTATPSCSGGLKLLSHGLLAIGRDTSDSICDPEHSAMAQRIGW